MTSIRAAILVLLLAVPAAASIQGAPANETPPRITVEESIDSAMSGLGYFERSQRFQDFQGVLLTLAEINGNGSASAPLARRWDIREQQIKQTYEAWFHVFQALDALKLSNYDPLAPENRCSLTIAPPDGYPGVDPKNVANAAERKAYEAALRENQTRCARNEQQAMLPQLDRMAQTSFHTFLGSLLRPDGEDWDSGSYFAIAIAQSDLSGHRVKRMWRIFDARGDRGWNPKHVADTATAYSASNVLAFDENVTPAEARTHLAGWLSGDDPRAAAWAAHDILHDRLMTAVPGLLNYVHTHSFDPAFNMNTDYVRQGGPKVQSATEAMAAALDTLIELRAHVPADDLLQLAQAFPDQALILAVVPRPQDEVLEFFYLTDGLNQLQPNERYFVERQTIPPPSPGSYERWLAAGDQLVNEASKKFAGELTNRFVLVLHLRVRYPNGTMMGGGPINMYTPPKWTDETGWPKTGQYRLSVVYNAPASFAPGNSHKGAQRIEPEVVSVIAGATAVNILHYADSEATYAPYQVPPKFLPQEDIRAHWMESLGLGRAGTAMSYDLWNPVDYAGLNAADRLREFQFYKVVMYRDDSSYHEESKSWFATQHDVYARILAGLLKKRLIGREEASRPMRIDVRGIDERMPSAHSNVTFLTAAPWDDLTPPNTSISWNGQWQP
jgi:hypothetical protein